MTNELPTLETQRQMRAILAAVTPETCLSAAQELVALLKCSPRQAFSMVLTVLDKRAYQAQEKP